MLATQSKQTKKMGRPRRDDKIDRVNLNLNSNVRAMLRSQASQNGRTEGSQVERLVLEAQALQNIMQSDPEFAATVLPRLNAEVFRILETLTQDN